MVLRQSPVVATRPEPTVRPPSRCYGTFVCIANHDKMGIFLSILSQISSDFSDY